MTGNWGGLRDRLTHWGLTPTIDYSADILGNPVGGLRKDAAYAGLMNLYLDFDLEKILGLKSTKLVVSGYWSSGKNLSVIAIDNFFNVSNLFNGNSVGLYQLFIESAFVDEKIVFSIGRMGIGDDFATLELFNLYVSSAFDVFPISLSYNVPAFLSNPLAALGTRLFVKPDDGFYIAGGIYNASPFAINDDKFNGSIDFGFDDGVILISEAGLTPGNADGSGWLPGQYKIGAYYDTGGLAELADPDKKQDGNYGFYLIASQMVYAENSKNDQGLTLWASGTLAPEQEINQFPYFVSGGLVYEGPIPGRGSDTAAFGVAYGKLSRDLEGLYYEMAFEWTYAFQVFPWLAVQPDIQLIVNPGGSRSVPDALVAGFQVSIDI